MLAVRENKGSIFPDYLFSPDPFGYFRPLPKLFFYVMWKMFHESFFIYRIFVVTLHILNVILVYKISSALDFGKTASFVAALFFSVLTCHTEALFFINCITELLFAFFILTGLFLFSAKKYEGWFYVFAIIIFFLLALLSKESAIAYIPLVLLFYFFKIRLSIGKLTAILLIPVFVYAIIRYSSEMYFPGGNLGVTISSMDLDLLKIFYKSVHYNIMMLFPVKVIFEFLGFDKLEFLINIYRQPMEHLAEFLAFTAFIFIVLTLILLLIIRKLKSDLFFPVLFSLISLSIYLFSFSTAERYSYLSSAGVCILIGILYVKSGGSMFIKVMLILFFCLHLFSFVQRSYRYRQAADFSRQSIINLNKVTEGIKENSYVKIISLPPKQYGIYFLNVPNFYYNWEYNFPERKINFEFTGNTLRQNHDAVFDYDNGSSTFKRME